MSSDSKPSILSRQMQQAHNMHMHDHMHTSRWVQVGGLPVARPYPKESICTPSARALSTPIVGRYPSSPLFR
jgi:hypothetical protein